jgi:hypothetical protein
MTRRFWLTTFLKLVDTGAAAIEYRKQLRIKTNFLGPHIKKIDVYRKELAELVAVEKKNAEEQQRKAKAAADAEAARKAHVARRLDEARARERARNAAKDADTRSDPETLGTREDTSED